MYFTILTLNFFLTGSSEIFSLQMNSIKIDNTHKNFTVIASGGPADAFLIATYTSSANLKIVNNEWIRSYDFFSIENYFLKIPQLTLATSSYQNMLTVTICSLTTPIPANAYLSVTYDFPSLECYNGTIEEGSCDCDGSSIGSNCDIPSTILFPSFENTFEIVPYSTKFFKIDTSFGGGHFSSISIITQSGNLQSFFRYILSNTSELLPSFLCTENFIEYNSQDVQFHDNQNRGEDPIIIFSVFCFDSDPCVFLVEVNDDHGGDGGEQHGIGVIVIVFCVVGPICIIFVVFLIIRCCKKQAPTVESHCWIKETLDKTHPVIEIEEKKRIEDCSVCFENYTRDWNARKILCGHVFHASCIDEWFETNPFCPLCRHCYRNLFIKV